ncbi:S-ribosylhomocysteine lyase [Olsenella sp. KGMB02461]|nr:S-ribosylhomocysteine lyase [Olsenella sp. KGMB02461]
MDKIASFTVNHLTLEPGVYVSRKDQAGDEVITTFDVRMTTPNKEPVIDTAAIHCLEHLGATYLRNHPTWADRVIYFGPMGCRTGFYLVMAGDMDSRDIVPLVTELFEWAAGYEGTIPGADPKECGNYLDLNLPMAQWEARRYLDRTLHDIDEAHLVYSE